MAFVVRFSICHKCGKFNHCVLFLQDERRDSDAVHLNLSNGGVREPLAESPSERGDPDVRPLIKGTPTSGPVAVFEHTNETNSGPLPTINRNKVLDTFIGYLHVSELYHLRIWSGGYHVVIT